VELGVGRCVGRRAEVLPAAPELRGVGPVVEALKELGHGAVVGVHGLLGSVVGVGEGRLRLRERRISATRLPRCCCHMSSCSPPVACVLHV
jgi:hypothetical protein